MSWTRALRAAAIGLIAALAFHSSARARPRSFSLNWVRDANATSCIASAELAKIVERALGPVFVTPAEAEFAIEGRVQREPESPRWSAQISLSDRSGALLGSRVVHSPRADCRALNLQIALVVILIIDPEAALDGLPAELLDIAPDSSDPAADLLAELTRERAAREAAAEAAREPVSQAREPPPPPAAKPPQPDPQSRGFELEAGLALGSGQLPQLGAGAQLGARLVAARRLSFALRTRLWLPNDAVAATEANDAGRVTFMMSATTLEACAVPLQGRRLTLDVCAGLALAVRWTTGSELDEPQSSVHASIGPALSTQLAINATEQLAVVLGASVDLPLNPPTFVYDDASGREQELFTPDAVAVTTWLGAAYRFF